MILMLTVCVAVHAEGDGSDSASQDQTPTEKSPPSPLFPRHRRGLYKNGQGLEVIDATPQSPPLATDDPGVPEKGEYEINLVTRADLSTGAKSLDLLVVDANYGMLPTIAKRALPMQLKFECPLAAVAERGSPFTVGVGAAALGLKLNVFSSEHTGVSISVYPQVEFATPGAHSAEKGLADAGQTLILPLLVSREFKYLTLVANGALNTPVHDRERETTGSASFGVGLPARRKVAVMVELRGESALDSTHERLVVLNGGVIHGVRKLIAYGQVGRSFFAADGFSHAYVGGGIKVFVKTRHSQS